ncbi:hypothetical protein GGF32_007495 [Allomyces javanicus]|nr:hypothetical protein GGF32_007495 [Allomyces javanicus]
MPMTRSATAAAAATTSAAAHDTAATVAPAPSVQTDAHLAALAPTPSTASTPAAATTAAPAAISRANRPRKFDDLPVDVLARILSRAVAGHEPDTLQLLLSWSAINQTWKAVIEGDYLKSYYETLLVQWNVKAAPNPRARKYRTYFSLVMREVEAGRCATCRSRVEPGKAPVGGRCTTCRVRSLLELRSLDPTAFRAMARRRIVGFDVEKQDDDAQAGGGGYRRRRRKHKEARLYKSMILGSLHLPTWLAEELPYRAKRNPYYRRAAPMRLYEIRVVERVMAVWTGRTNPPIDISQDVPDWRELDRQESSVHADGADGSEDNNSEEEGEYDEDDEGEWGPEE